MDQLPRSADLMAKAVTALLGDLAGERRDARERYAQSSSTGGRYGDVLRGWQGQAELIRARLVKEVLATRLDSSEGQELKDLAKSEYFAELPNDPRKAVGESTVYRQVINQNPTTTGNFTAGVIPAGTRIKRSAPKAPRAGTVDAEYVTTAPVSLGTVDSSTSGDLGDGTYSHTQLVTLPIEATREGPYANIPQFQFFYPDGLTASLSGQVADTYVVQSLTAAGGTLGPVDDQLRALARALSTGSNGPTEQALVAGALTSPGVRHVAYVDDAATGTATIYAADESWAASTAYQVALLQALRSPQPWVGWGCRARVGQVSNFAITIACTVLLRSPEYTSAEIDITANIVTALRAYFDDRPDWYTWALESIGAVIGAADDRILACTTVTVVSAGDGTVFASIDETGHKTGFEPPVTIGASIPVHYMLIDHIVSPTFQVPGS